MKRETRTQLTSSKNKLLKAIRSRCLRSVRVKVNLNEVA